jgi:hypothetical protein
MKGKSCIPENLCYPLAGLAETDSVMRTGMPADSIRARAPATAPQHDAGYMAATSPSAEQRFPSCNAGRTIYGVTVADHPPAAVGVPVADPEPVPPDTTGMVAWQATTLEAWREITAKYGPGPSAREVLRWLRDNGPRDVFPADQQGERNSLLWRGRDGVSRPLSLKNVGDRLSEWRKAGWISARVRRFP